MHETKIQHLILFSFCVKKYIYFSVFALQQVVTEC